MSKLDVLLSEKEKKQLKSLNKKSNNLQNKSRSDNDFLNLSIHQLFKNWANNNIEILADLIKFISNISIYSRFFDDIDQTGQWFTGIMHMTKDLYNIFTINDRSIYIGITFIVISFGLYLIQITS